MLAFEMDNLDAASGNARVCRCELQGVRCQVRAVDQGHRCRTPSCHSSDSPRKRANGLKNGFDAATRHVQIVRSSQFGSALEDFNSCPSTPYSKPLSFEMGKGGTNWLTRVSSSYAKRWTSGGKSNDASTRGVMDASMPNPDESSSFFTAACPSCQDDACNFSAGGTPIPSSSTVNLPCLGSGNTFLSLSFPQILASPYPELYHHALTAHSVPGSSDAFPNPSVTISSFKSLSSVSSSDGKALVLTHESQQCDLALDDSFSDARGSTACITCSVSSPGSLTVKGRKANSSGLLESGWIPSGSSWTGTPSDLLGWPSKELGEDPEMAPSPCMEEQDGTTAGKGEEWAGQEEQGEDEGQGKVERWAGGGFTREHDRGVPLTGPPQQQQQQQQQLVGQEARGVVAHGSCLPADLPPLPVLAPTAAAPSPHPPPNTPTPAAPVPAPATWLHHGCCYYVAHPTDRDDRSLAWGSGQQPFTRQCSSSHRTLVQEEGQQDRRPAHQHQRHQMVHRKFGCSNQHNYPGLLQYQKCCAPGRRRPAASGACRAAPHPPHPPLVMHWCCVSTRGMCPSCPTSRTTGPVEPLPCMSR
ncbi:hypothetical protein V8C86DRAFT_89740 [Haematococcus lacustris]